MGGEPGEHLLLERPHLSRRARVRRVLEQPLGEVEPLPGALERLDGVGEGRRPRPGGDRVDLGAVLTHPRLELGPEVDAEVGQAHPRECSGGRSPATLVVLGRSPVGRGMRSPTSREGNT